MKQKINEKPWVNNVVLTIDVGIKNLAMCVIDSHYNIHLWDVYNILEENDDSKTCEISKKDGEVCGKKSQYKYTTDKLYYCCKKHFPKNIKIEKHHIIKNKKVNEYLLQYITQRILKNVREIFETNKDVFTKITNICIELQPKVNQRMKFISHVLYATFVDLYQNTDIPIRFIRASQNLQAYNGPPVECKLKTPYSRRKFLSIAYTKWYLESGILKTTFNQDKNWLNMLMSHSKKDDLCDVINSNMNVHKGLTNKQKRNKNNSEIK
jgi:hypothetical protein